MRNVWLLGVAVLAARVPDAAADARTRTAARATAAPRMTAITAPRPAPRPDSRADLRADPRMSEPAPLAHRWPGVPRSRALSLEDQLTDRLTMIGNALGQHLDLLSHDMFQLRVDARARRARIRMGGGDPATFSLRVDGDIQVDDLNARVHARLALGVRGHELAIELPRFDVCPSAVRGDRGVEIKLPLFERAF